MKFKISVLFLLLSVGISPIAHAQKYIISTVAGNGVGSGSFGSYSGDGGPATLAGLNGPSSVAVDDSGNLYICDETNSRIRKVDVDGIMTTFAGRSDSGWVLNDGHPATDASLSEPWGVAWSPRGVFISDWNNRRIRKVDNNGIISTIAGTGAYGYTGDGGPGDSATMSNPYGITVDKFGNVYFCDAFNNVVRKIDTNDIITTFAGTGVKSDYGDGGQATDAGINEPLGVHCDTSGNIYICTFVYIRKVDLSGIITTVCGNGSAGHSGDGGPATQASMALPFDACVDDSGNIYFTEYAYYTGNYVRRVNVDDTIKSIAGNGTRGYNNYEGNPDTAKFWFPLGSITDHVGNIFFADETNQLVRELSPCSAPITTLPLNPHICRGVSIALTAQGYNTYSWSPGSSLQDSIGYNVIATPSVTTTYTITGTTCLGNATIVVTVDTTTKAPALKINPGSATLCNGQTVTLTASGASSYTWSPMWSLSSSTGSSVVATPSISTTYVVMEPTCSATDTSFITVNPVPSIYVYPATTTSFCNGQTITLYEGGANGFQWTPLTGLDTTAYDSVNANPTVTTTYVVVGNSAGCYSTPDTVVLTVNPVPNVSINPPNPGFCTGTSTTIIAGGAATYLWGPFTGISDTIGDTIVANPTITFTYTITGTSAAGCVSPSDTFTVSVDNMPIISVSPPSASICQGTNTTLIANGAPEYLWSPSTGLSSSTGDTVIAGPATTTTYLVRGGTYINDSLTCVANDSIVVTVIASPNKPTFYRHGDTLTSSAVYDNQWYINGILLNGDTSQDLIITESGEYWVIVANEANGCSTASDSMNITVTGLNQLSANSYQLSIYPNPTGGEITIFSTKPIDAIIVTNLLGQTVLKSHSGDLGVTRLTFELNDEGMYFVTVKSEEGIKVGKVLVTK